MTDSPDHGAAFRQEAEELFAQLEQALLDLEDRPDDTDLVNSAFRALHTIKGSGAMFGYEALAAFTHHVETAFDLVRAGRLAMSRSLTDLTLRALDHMRGLIEAPEAADAELGERLLAGVTAIVGGAAPEGGDAPGPQAKAQGEDTPAGPATYRIRLRLADQAMAYGTNPLLLLDELRDLGECTVVACTAEVPRLEDLDPTACHVAWDVLLTTDRPRGDIEDVFIFVADDSDLKIEPLSCDGEEAARRRLGEILIQRGDVSAEAVDAVLARQTRLGHLLVGDGVTDADRVNAALAEQHHVRRQSAAATARSQPVASSIRVQADRLDSLMDQVGELVIAQARLRQLAGDSDNLTLKSVAEEIERLSAELRDTTMGIRMVQIGTLFGRFRRVVRDLSAELGKQVELRTEGEETELDKTVIESLNDPLVHLIRNAIDHGIDAAGTLTLSAVHAGAQVHITVRDDGRGMNRSAIRARAIERGLIEADADLTDPELFAFVLHPGFSTAEKVTNVSGRGVGMDVVKRTIDGLRGSIEVTSTPGEGTAITLKLPLTLAIIDGLLVRVGAGRYVIPLSAVEECVELTPEDDTRSTGRSFLNIRDDIVPFVRLRGLFNLAGQPDDIQKVVIVSAGRRPVGLVVDQVVGQYQTVIKSLSKLHDDAEGFSGATILGDGTVALILDVPHLLDYAQERESVLKAS